MKKFYIIILIAIVTYCLPTATKASTDDKTINIESKVKIAEENTEQKNIISSQTDALGISTFLSDSEKYTEETFGELDINDIFTKSLSGEIDNNTIMNIIFALLGDNVKTALSTIASVMVVVVIHSVLKAISENLGNENVSKIAYYIEYILIITLVMANFRNNYNGNETSSPKLNRICKFANTTYDYTYDYHWKYSIIGNASANITFTYNIYK